MSTSNTDERFGMKYVALVLAFTLAITFFAKRGEDAALAEESLSTEQVAEVPPPLETFEVMGPPYAGVAPLTPEVFQVMPALHPETYVVEYSKDGEVRWERRKTSNSVHVVMDADGRIVDVKFIDTNPENKP